MKKLTFGGWYQRTTLHLTEVYQFLSQGTSNLDLSKESLEANLFQLDIKSVKRVSDYLEYIEVITNSKIKIKYYEDRLYLFEILSDTIEEDSQKLKDYFEKNWKPAIDYLFSLGAPTPKILSNLKDDHPVVIGELSKSPGKEKVNESLYGKIYSDILSKKARVIKTKKFILVFISTRKKEDLDSLVEMQIFFREFKWQLHRYLNIHRNIWEEISQIKEKKQIRGKDADEYRLKLDSYQKTIRLISNRINQMSVYAKTRSSLSKYLKVEEELVSLFQYKYEDLFNSLEYIKEIWKMTLDYVDSAIQMINEIKTKTAVSGIKSIQLLTSIGAIAGVVRLASPNAIPSIDKSVAIFLICLFGISYLIDWSLKFFTNYRKYQLKFVEQTKDI